jgi:hypothetical protein
MPACGKEGSTRGKRRRWGQRYLKGEPLPKEGEPMREGGVGGCGQATHTVLMFTNSRIPKGASSLP